jgi:myo-inositol 2-dehydrogenase/D-chiro-inositol 1-dehydrogenase
VGLIGAGAIARRHVEALRTHPDVTIAAVCDVDAGRAEELAAAAGGRAVTDWAELVDGEGVEAVVVCTPPAAHAEPAVAALERGLAVYLEKPLARSAGDGERIVAAWRRSGAVCAVGYQWRSLELLGRLRDALAGCPPGMLVSRSYGPTEPGRGDLTAAGRGSWFADRAASGGILFELGSHDIDLQVALAGPAAHVQASGARGLLALHDAKRDLDDAVAVVIEFAGGALGVLAVAWNPAHVPPVYTLDVDSAAAGLQLELDPGFRLTGSAAGAAVDVREDADPRQRSIDRFLAAARAGNPAAVACTPADALHTLRAALAAERAIATGQRVAV